jgi:hypothetical protein
MRASTHVRRLAFHSLSVHEGRRARIEAIGSMADGGRTDASGTATSETSIRTQNTSN